MDPNMTALLGCLLGVLCGFLAPYMTTWALSRQKRVQDAHFKEMSERYELFQNEHGRRPSRKGDGDERFIALWAVDIQEAAMFGELTRDELDTLDRLHLPHSATSVVDPMRFEFHPSIMFRGMSCVLFAAFGLLTFYFLPSTVADKEFLLLFCLFATVMTMTDLKARIIPLGASVALVGIALFHQFVVHGVHGALCALAVAMGVTVLAWLLGKVLEICGRPSPVGGGDLLFLFGVGCATGTSGILFGAAVSTILGCVPLMIAFMMHKVKRDTYVPMGLWLGIWMLAGCIGNQMGIV